MPRTKKPVEVVSESEPEIEEPKEEVEEPQEEEENSEEQDGYERLVEFAEKYDIPLEKMKTPAELAKEIKKHEKSNDIDDGMFSEEIEKEKEEKEAKKSKEKKKHPKLEDGTLENANIWRQDETSKMVIAIKTVAGDVTNYYLPVNQANMNRLFTVAGIKNIQDIQKQLPIRIKATAIETENEIIVQNLEGGKKWTIKKMK